MFYGPTKIWMKICMGQFCPARKMLAHVSATEFGVNRRSLTKYLNGQLLRKKGGQQTFHPIEESVLEQLLHNAAEIGVPLKRRFLLKIVARIAAGKGMHTTVSKEWLQRFRKHHPCLSERISHATDRKKDREWDQTKCDKWNTILSDLHIQGWQEETPEGLWNTAKTAFQSAEDTSKVFAT